MDTLKILILLLCAKFPVISGSDGDMSSMYQSCLSICSRSNCASDESFKNNSVLLHRQDLWSRLLWNCPDECGYHCMWTTVKGFHEKGYHTPKFYGKWPFVRLWGVQEPASTFASLLNLLAHLYMNFKLQNEFSVRSMPLSLLWHVFAAICINAWIWSAIFHTRDTPFSEFMDYACALSMVMSLFFAAVIRVFHRRRKMTVMLLMFPLLFFVSHVQYLYFAKVDYGYNMKVNIFFGVVGSALWLVWCISQALSGQRHAWRMVWFVALSAAALALEVFDFPPWRYVWDAHALWHLATAPLPLLFYRFVIDDLRFLQTGQYEKFT